MINNYTFLIVLGKILLVFSLLLTFACSRQNEGSHTPKGNDLTFIDSALKDVIEKYENFKNLLDSLEIFQMNHDYDNVLQNQLYIANEFRRAANYSEAMHFYDCAKITLNETNNIKSRCQLYNGLATTYFEIHCHYPLQRNALDSSKHYAYKSLKIADSINNLYIKRSALNILGAIALQLNLHEVAKAYLINAWAVNQEISETSHLALMMNLSHVYTQYGQYDSAIFFALECYQTATEQQETVFVGLSLQKLVELYKMIGDEHKALQFKRELDALEENREVYIHSLFMKKLILEHQKAKVEEALEKASHERYILVGINRLLAVITIVMVLIFIVLLYLLRQNRRLRLQEAELSLSRDIAGNLKIQNIELKLMNERLTANKLRSGLETKESKLASNLLALSNIEEFLHKLDSEIKTRKKKIRNKSVIKFLSEIERFLEARDRNSLWEEMEQIFSSGNSSFSKKLNDAHPCLTIVEKRLCYLILSGLSTKEIANISRKSYRAVEMARHRIRHKMNLAKDENLFTYLRTFISDVSS